MMFCGAVPRNAGASGDAAVRFVLLTFHHRRVVPSGAVKIRFQSKGFSLVEFSCTGRAFGAAGAQGAKSWARMPTAVQPAGTGSVSVELALAAPRGRVYAVECRPEGCALIKANREKFRTRNLVLVEGLAPAALSDLPAPDAVFIGGSKGSLAAIVDAALDKNPDARICVSAIALETLSAAVAALTAKGRTVQVSQIAVSRAKAVGGLHLMMAQNPIYLITGE